MRIVIYWITQSLNKPLGLFGNRNVLVRFDERCQRTLAHAESLTCRSMLSARYQNVVFTTARTVMPAVEDAPVHSYES